MFLDSFTMIRITLLISVVLFSINGVVESFSSAPSILLSRRVLETRTARKSTVAPEKVNGHEQLQNHQQTSIRLNVNEKARTVTEVCTSGTLCTLSTADAIAGAPFGSFVDYVLDDEGNPILLMNEMSMHTLNINANPLVTLFTQLEAGDEQNNQDVSRCSVTGTLTQIDDTDDDESMELIRMRYSITHSYADQVMDSPKFAFYRLVPKTIYFVGGFGVLAKWIDVEDYKHAAPDILAAHAAAIVRRVNRDHTDDLRWTATQLLQRNDLEKVRLTSVDRLGMDIRVTSQVGTRRNKLQTDEFRIGFRIPVISVEDAKSEILKVFQEAWEKGNGISWGDAEEDQPGADVPIAQIAADSLE